MSNYLSIERLDDITAKAAASVIPIWPVTRKNGKRRKRVSKKKAEKKIPLFYTAPIFKPRKHDFL